MWGNLPDWILCEIKCDLKLAIHSFERNMPEPITHWPWSVWSRDSSYVSRALSLLVHCLGIVRPAVVRIPVRHQNIKQWAWLTCPQKITDCCYACHFCLRKRSLHFSPSQCKTLDFLSTWLSVSSWWFDSVTLVERCRQSCVFVFVCVCLCVWVHVCVCGGCQQEWDVCLGDPSFPRIKVLSPATCSWLWWSEFQMQVK